MLSLISHEYTQMWQGLPKSDIPGHKHVLGVSEEATAQYTYRTQVGDENSIILYNSSPVTEPFCHNDLGYFN
jgi:hypothetical protein